MSKLVTLNFRGSVVGVELSLMLFNFVGVEGLERLRCVVSVVV